MKYLRADMTIRLAVIVGGLLTLGPVDGQLRAAVDYGHDRLAMGCCTEHLAMGDDAFYELDGDTSDAFDSYASDQYDTEAYGDDSRSDPYDAYTDDDYRTDEYDAYTDDDDTSDPYDAYTDDAYTDDAYRTDEYDAYTDDDDTSDPYDAYTDDAYRTDEYDAYTDDDDRNDAYDNYATADDGDDRTDDTTRKPYEGYRDYDYDYASEAYDSDSYEAYESDSYDSYTDSMSDSIDRYSGDGCGLDAYDAYAEDGDDYTNEAYTREDDRTNDNVAADECMRDYYADEAYDAESWMEDEWTPEEQTPANATADYACPDEEEFSYKYVPPAEAYTRGEAEMEADEEGEAESYQDDDHWMDRDSAAPGEPRPEDTGLFPASPSEMTFDEPTETEIDAWMDDDGSTLERSAESEEPFDDDGLYPESRYGYGADMETSAEELGTEPDFYYPGTREFDVEPASDDVVEDSEVDYGHGYGDGYQHSTWEEKYGGYGYAEELSGQTDAGFAGAAERADEQSIADMDSADQSHSYANEYAEPDEFDFGDEASEEGQAMDSAWDGGPNEADLDHREDMPSENNDPIRAAGLETFGYLPSHLLIRPDQELLRELRRLADRSSVESEVAFEQYVESLGSEAIEFTTQYENATGNEAMSLADDVPACAAFLAVYRLYEQGEVGIGEAIDLVERTLGDLSLEWIESVNEITVDATFDSQPTVSLEPMTDRVSASVPRKLYEAVASWAGERVGLWKATLSCVGALPMRGLDWHGLLSLVPVDEEASDFD